MVNPTNPINRRLPADYTFEKRRKKFLEIEARCIKTESGCWLMPGGGSGTGYGAVAVERNGRRAQWPAHRFMWALVHGEIPEKLYVCHHCDVRLCVCPEHLFLGTHADNMADCVRKGRHAALRTRPLKPKPPKVQRGLITHDGRQITLRDLAAETGIPLPRLQQRYYVSHLRGADLVAPKKKPGRRRWRVYPRAAGQAVKQHSASAEPQ